MTTYEEISLCEKKNREFWTERARLCLALYRINKHSATLADARFDRHGFRSCMKSRREKKFLIKQGQMELML